MAWNVNPSIDLFIKQPSKTKFQCNYCGNDILYGVPCNGCGATKSKIIIVDTSVGTTITKSKGRPDTTNSSINIR